MAQDYIPEMGPTGASMLPKQTTAPGAGIDPFEPDEVPTQKLAQPESMDVSKLRAGRPRYDSFTFVISEGIVFTLLPEDPNRAFFKVACSFPPANAAGLIQGASIGKKSQLANGIGWVIGGVATTPDQQFSTTDSVAVVLRSGTPGTIATVTVWVEYNE